MKRLLIILFALILSVMSFVGCDDNIPDESIPPIIASDVIDEYDSQSRIEIEESVSNDNPSSQPNNENVSNIESENGSFLIKDKKYTYDGKDLVILNISNHSSQNYTITVNGSYNDENGNAIKSESKVFKGLEAGDSGHLLFMPEINFDSFTYTVSIDEHNGEYLQSQVKGLEWNEDTANFNTYYGLYTGFESQKSYMLFTKFFYINNNETELYITGKVILFDKNDNILKIKDMGYICTPPHEKGGNDMMFYSSYDTKLTKDKSTWPEEYQDGLYLIFIPTDVAKRDELPAGFFG